MMGVGVAAGLMVVMSSSAGADWAMLSPSDEIQQRMTALSESSDGRVTLTQIGTSRGGRPIHLVTISGSTDPDAQPAVLIVAGINGEHLVGIDVALGVAESLADADTDLLDHATIYVVPCLNPDSAAFHADPSAPRMSFGRTFSPDDADRDRRIDEDGPLDLNGDGIISMMRIKDPGPEFDLQATRIADADEPRLMREPDADKGEIADYAVLVEGRDQDGDGSIAEDGVGGVDLDMNFPYRWPEFADGAGWTSLSEPESKALVDWMLARTNIVMAVSYGPADTLVTIPKAGAMDETGQISKGIEKDDKLVYEEIAEVFKEITGMTAAPTHDSAGSFRGWAYAYMGVYSFSTPIWVRPDQIKRAEDKDSDAADEDAAEGEAEENDDDGEETDPFAELIKQGATPRIAEMLTASPAERQQMMGEFMSMSQEDQQAEMAAFGAMPAAMQARAQAVMQGGEDPGPSEPEETSEPDNSAEKKGKDKKKKKSEDAKWLAYADERGEGFIEWTAFDHPDLGPVELGGFVPGFKFSPPDGELPRLVDEQAQFITALLERLPKIEVSGVTVEDRGGGIWQISMRVTNAGKLPTRAASGVKARRLAPLRIELDLPDERVIAGNRRRLSQSLAPGGHLDARWLILAEPGESITIGVLSIELGDQTITATMQEDDR